jgi:replicative DNA helicase
MPEKTTNHTNTATEKVPPQSLDVERTVLGSILIDNRAAAKAIELLSPENFYATQHKRIFICMREMFAKSVPIDILTVAEELRKHQWLNEVGEEAYLNELTESVATSANIEHYTQIVREKSTLRRLISASADITTDCFSQQKDTGDILENAQQKIFDIAQSEIKGDYTKIEQLLPKAFKEIETYSKKGGGSGIRSGFDSLDDMTSGFQKGDLIIVAGRPSMGKTALCLDFAIHAALHTDPPTPTLIFSLEMSSMQIVQRMLCSQAHINMHKLRSGKLSRDEHPRLSLAAGPLSQAPLFVDDSTGISPLELAAKARRLKAQHGLGLIIVDYLQLMSSVSRAESRQQEITQISRSLKNTAKELEVPVISLSQLSRAVEQRGGDHRPQLSDLRESGAIEQDADMVIFVYRESRYKKEEDVDGREGVAELIIGKQRNGPVGKVEVAFVEEYAKFENLSPLSQEDDSF